MRTCQTQRVRDLMKKKKTKTLAKLKKDAWSLLSELVRLRAADEGGTVQCYTCGKLGYWRADGMQAGHAIPGRHGAVLFDEEIIRVQCYACNCGRGGNYPVFTTKLIREKGLEWWEGKLAGSSRVVKYTRADLQALIDNYRENIEGLEAVRSG